MNPGRPSRCLLIVLLAVLPAASTLADLAVGLMPAENSIPLVVAAHDGLFAAEGVKVMLVPFSGQLERETALRTGAIDATVSDLVNALQGWAHGSPARVVSVTEGAFALLASPQSGLKAMSGVASRTGTLSTGLLENSLVYYLTEKMLRAAGVDPARIDLVPIVQLPARLEMLVAGKIDAACLPEPLATLAETRGARRLADTSTVASVPGVLLFTGAALAGKVREIEAFYRAYNRAVAAVNADPGRYRDAIVSGCDFPPAVGPVMRIPRFSPARPPSQADINDVAGWMQSKGLLASVPGYRDVVSSAAALPDARAQ
jgi:NitT/TauT family transport system substrate-binding protein